MEDTYPFSFPSFIPSYHYFKHLHIPLALKVGEEVIFDHLFINKKGQILIDNGIHNTYIAFLIQYNALFQIYYV